MNGNPDGLNAIPPRKQRLRRDPLASLTGLITESGRVYRKMKAGKLDHDKGRSLVWVLAQMRAMLEAQELEKINARLEELGQVAESRYGAAGMGREHRLPN